MSGRLPDFVVIGAMKCGTSSLHEQLDRRSRVVMSRPKEPNFFSDDARYARGLAWYAGLFADAPAGSLCGESSTHYTKLPTHPRTVERMREHLPGARLVYVMRDPIERIVSQYLHEWSQREVKGSLEEAVRRHERFVAYSAYARQLEPWLEAYGPAQLLPVAFERLVACPDAELARICRFLADPSPEPVGWEREEGRQNPSEERLRRSRLREATRRVAPLRWLKERLPEATRERLKAPWRLPARPELSPATRARLERELDPDLRRLGEWLGLELSCATWKAHASEAPLRWRAPPGAFGGGAPRSG